MNVSKNDTNNVLPIKLVVLVSGSGTNLQSIIQACDDGRLNANISLVVSNKNDAYALQRAADANIQSVVVSPEKSENREQYDRRLLQAIDPFQPDLIILAGYMRILSIVFVNEFKDRILNIHPSLLPKYKGTNTHQRVLEAGDKEHGATVHIVTSALDAGPIIMQRKVSVEKTDTAETLRLRVLEQEHLLYPEAIKVYLRDCLEK